MKKIIISSVFLILFTPNGYTKNYKVDFRLEFSGAKEVHLLGDFNGWKPDTGTLMENRDGVWHKTILFPEGIYRYGFKAVSDKQLPDNGWIIDRNNPLLSHDKGGTTYSMLIIPDYSTVEDIIKRAAALIKKVDTSLGYLIVKKEFDKAGRLLELEYTQPFLNQRTTSHKKLEKTFKLRDNNLTRVYLLGDFNDWEVTDENEMKKTKNMWTKKISLDEGVYQYKFKAEAERELNDDGWMIDKQNPLIYDNIYEGYTNSIISVPRNRPVKDTFRETAGNMAQIVNTIRYFSARNDATTAKLLVEQLQKILNKNNLLIAYYMKKDLKGKKAPPFAARDINDNPVSLKDYRGKVTLLDFWATWCGPCIIEMPNVIAIYDRYHDKGLEVIGISLDRDIDRLRRFLKSNNIKWPQVCDRKTFSGEIPKKYHVNSIPSTFLIDGEGKIIAVDLRGAGLENRIKELLKK